MKNQLLIIAILILIIFCFLSCTYVSSSNTLLDSKELATIDNPVVSPSGEYMLKISQENIDNLKQQRFEIYKVIDGKVSANAIFISNDFYQLRFTTFFLWDDKDRVWVYSGDLGTFYWVHNDDDYWEKYSYIDNKIPVPTLLKQLRPNHFDD